jgi:hypothetical protein
MEEKDLSIECLLNMKLHEIKEVNKNRNVMRVPGGWVYRAWDSWSKATPAGSASTALSESMVFVPEPLNG